MSLVLRVLTSWNLNERFSLSKKDAKIISLLWDKHSELTKYDIIIVSYLF